MNAHARHFESFGSLTEAIATWAEVKGTQPAVSFLKGSSCNTLTYLELHRKALEIAGYVREFCTVGDRVLLGTEQGLDYISGFLGCIYAGVVPVTSAPPDESRTGARLARLLTDSGASVIMSNDASAAKFAGAVSDVRILNVDTALAQPMDQPADAPRDRLMFLQYTSGSTSAPRGVMLTHSSVVDNLRAIASDTRPHDSSVYVTWLPLYHDMGLIFMTLAPLFAGCQVYLLSPQEFLRHPHRWLAAIGKYRGTFTAAPNFAFRLCVDRIPPSIDSTLDLSSMEYFVNGSEPVRVEDMRSFQNRFASAGVRRNAMVGAYGLAEVGVYVCSGAMLDRQSAFDRATLDDAGKVRSLTRDGTDARLVAACGAANPEHFDLRIVEPSTGEECPPGSTGEIWVSGPSKGQGYWRQDETTAEVFRARLAGRPPEYLRTGDIGFVHDGQLYISGRIKEMMIVRGRNLFPGDICQIVENIGPAMSGRRSSAFTVPGPIGEELVIVCAARVREADRRRLAVQIVGAVTAREGVVPSNVVFVQNRALKRTTSGKIQHGALREAYLGGSLEADYALRSFGGGINGNAQPDASSAFDVFPSWLVQRICAHCSRICETGRVEPEQISSR